MRHAGQSAADARHFLQHGSSLIYASALHTLGDGNVKASVPQERGAAAGQRRHADELRLQIAAKEECERAARVAARSEGAEGRARQAAHMAAIEVS